MTERLIVLSDLHLAPPGPLCGFHAGHALAGLLRVVVSPGLTLVLNGDTFDLLQVPGRPRDLDLQTGPVRLAAFLRDIEASAWGRAVFQALEALLRAHGRVVLVPGNHDLELFHPDCQGVLRRALNLPEDHPGLTVHRLETPWFFQLGPWEVVVGHGHRGETANDIDPASILEAIAAGRGDVRLPPGSRLVLDVVQCYQMARNPDGSPRFPFVDLLKPDKAAALLLYALDPRLARTHLGPLARSGTRTLLAEARRRLYRGPVLQGEPGDDVFRGEPVDDVFRGEPGEATWEDAGQGLDVPGLLAEALLEGLSEDEWAAPEAMLEDLEAWLTLGESAVGVTDVVHGDVQGHGVRGDVLAAGAAADGVRGDVLAAGDAPASVRGDVLATGGSPRWVRSLLRSLSQDGNFFDPDRLSPVDRRIIKAHLPPGEGARVVIAGHTHAARQRRMMDNRVYLNTGTWTRLMRLPRLEGDEDTRGWLETLRAGSCQWVERLSYAEVTLEGPVLRFFTGETEVSTVVSPTGREPANETKVKDETEGEGARVGDHREVVTRWRPGLAALMSDPTLIRVVVWDAGIRPEAVMWSASPEGIWQSVLEEAARGGRESLERLMRTVVARYPENPEIGALMGVGYGGGRSPVGR